MGTSGEPKNELEKTKIFYLNRPLTNLGLKVRYKLEGFKIDNKTLDTCESFNYLELKIHKHLKWQTLCKNKTNKVQKVLRSLHGMRGNSRWDLHTPSL